MTVEKPGRIQDLKLLLVEDNAFTAMTVGKSLESLGLEGVLTAGNGHEALAFLDRDENPPDVILMDLRMPGMGGLELISRLKDRRYMGYIVVTSGVDEETMNAVREVALSSHINVLGFLPKPLTAKSLDELLKQAVW